MFTIKPTIKTILASRNFTKLVQTDLLLMKITRYMVKHLPSLLWMLSFFNSQYTILKGIFNLCFRTTLILYSLRVKFLRIRGFLSSLKNFILVFHRHLLKFLWNFINFIIFFFTRKSLNLKIFNPWARWYLLIPVPLLRFLVR